MEKHSAGQRVVFFFAEKTSFDNFSAKKKRAETSRNS